LRTPNCRRALGLLLLDWSSVVLNHSPGSIQARWETLRVQQGSCLWWLVRDTDTAPNAPNAAVRERCREALCWAKRPFKRGTAKHVMARLSWRPRYRRTAALSTRVIVPALSPQEITEITTPGQKGLMSCGDFALGSRQLDDAKFVVRVSHCGVGAVTNSHVLMNDGEHERGRSWCWRRHARSVLFEFSFFSFIYSSLSLLTPSTPQSEGRVLKM
jgi:hypothetical protein